MPCVESSSQLYNKFGYKFMHKHSQSQHIKYHNHLFTGLGPETHL